jgi:hypothetical protein
MKIELERLYRLKRLSSFPADGDDDDLFESVEEEEIKKTDFTSLTGLSEKTKDFSIKFVFTGNVLKEVQIKSNYSLLKDNTANEILDIDEKTIKRRLLLNLKSEYRDSIILITPKEKRKNRSVDTLKAINKTFWVWRFDIFCNCLLSEELRNKDVNLYRAIKEFLFGESAQNKKIKF